ncbi:MAG TPA: hypothetical protein VG757_06210 [Devosia sp.]|jgi:hypothetical protein|nr:hypothetical protein [Devosia sp.]
MAQLIQFPRPPRFIPSDSELALVRAVDALGAYQASERGNAAEICAELLALPEIGSRLATRDQLPEEIQNAGNALDLIAGALEQHYVEGLSAAEVCDQLKGLCERTEIVEMHDAVVARSPGGIKSSERWH